MKIKGRKFWLWRAFDQNIDRSKVSTIEPPLIDCTQSLADQSKTAIYHSENANEQSKAIGRLVDCPTVRAVIYYP